MKLLDCSKYRWLGGFRMICWILICLMWVIIATNPSINPVCWVCRGNSHSLVPRTFLALSSMLFRCVPMLTRISVFTSLSGVKCIPNHFNWLLRMWRCRSSTLNSFIAFWGGLYLWLLLLVYISELRATGEGRNVVWSQMSCTVWVSCLSTTEWALYRSVVVKKELFEVKTPLPYYKSFCRLL